MTREELEKEAEKYCERQILLEDVRDNICNAYFAGAEPREKRIEELERALSVCNASNSFNKAQFTRAKDIIIRLLEVLVVIDGEQTKELKEVKEAEQFLKEEENDR